MSKNRHLQTGLAFRSTRRRRPCFSASRAGSRSTSLPAPPPFRPIYILPIPHANLGRQLAIFTTYS